MTLAEVDHSMRAAIYRNFGGRIEIESVLRPSLSAPSSSKSGEYDSNDDAVILQVMATGVCRSDWHGWKGHDSDIRKHGLPFCPGHELSGVVVEVGKKVSRFRIGDRVAVPFILSCGECMYCCEKPFSQPTVCLKQEQPGFTRWGSFAEYVLLPRADRNLQKLPSRVSFVQAAALGCRFTTAFRALLTQGKLVEILMKNQRNQNADDCRYQSHKADPTSSFRQTTPTTLAIFGCGGLGLACIMIASAAVTACVDARSSQSNIIDIIAVDVSQEALQKAKILGATHTVLAARPKNNKDKQYNYHQFQSDVQKKVLDLTPSGLGVDLSIDAGGFKATCENAVHCTKPKGRMIQVGLPIDNESEKFTTVGQNEAPMIPMGLVAGKELEIVGSHGFAANTELPQLMQWVEDGILDPEKLVVRMVSLEEGIKAIQDMDHGSPLGITMVTQFRTSMDERGHPMKSSQKTASMSHL